VHRSAFRIAHACHTAFGRYHHHRSPFTRQDEESLWVYAKFVLRWSIFDNHLPRNELPDTDEAISFCCEQRSGDGEKN
jgi:hypothetical protein